MERWTGRVALVTGASVGIGAAVARALVQHGMKVVGCARSVDKIEKLAAECQSAGYPGTLIPYKCDLSNEEEILSMFSAIKTLHQGVDVCINNAGLARPEPLLSGKTEGWRTMIDVNVMAVSICTREAYQSMKERNIDDGHIININSMNGHSVVPQSVVHFYSATKYAVTALTEGLRQELREAKTHIRATDVLCFFSSVYHQDWWKQDLLLNFMIMTLRELLRPMRAFGVSKLKTWLMLSYMSSVPHLMYRLQIYR
ncbi:dehydrogenase/reductase SDR family member 11 isoform X2 [Cuculus canorus]|uniref:dehydrogenase/reductase SDR family member 11 isoform X2 n=1 Tax=Cuculus canorus TaxID=55661 RepID=UPI0023AB286F|nr:dehydrogenase/reductase SDR family member 11 isoform X2 [Cuculus canorus]